MGVPETRYAKANDGAYIAYKVAGPGPVDLIYVPGWDSRLELSWEQPLHARLLRSLASFSRLIMFDPRGTGLSDPVRPATPPPLEVLIEDITSVMDAVGSKQAALFGEVEGGPISTLFAATYPESTRALVLWASYARGAWAPDYPWAWTDDQFNEDMAREDRALARGWDEDRFLEWAEEHVPTLAHDMTLRPWLRKVSAPAGPITSLIGLLFLERKLDIRPILPSIHVPTLVMNRVGDRHTDVEEGRWLAQQIPGAKFVELPGEDHPPWAGDQQSVIEAISAFLGVSRPPPESHRVLATVLFVDIVGSTRNAVELGDAAWKDLVADFEERSTVEIARYSGMFVDMKGDEVLATFDGPARAVRCAQAIGASVAPLGLEIRAGCHTGEIERTGENTVRGIAVHIGARVGALARPSEILISQTVKDLTAGSGLVFEDAGEHELKGVPDRWRLYRVVGG